MEGRLEINYNGQWGTVCDDHFGQVSADVACQQLGFGYAVENKHVISSMRGSGPIWMDEVQCFGNETSLSKCPNNGWGQHNCHHWEDVYVKCSNVRLSGGTTSSEGLLEVYHDNEWGTVCDDLFDDKAGHVACRQMGFVNASWYGHVATSAAPATQPIWMDDVQCSGTETDITDCPSNGWGNQNCGHYEDVQLVCETGAGLATTPIRLVPAGGASTGVTTTWTKMELKHCWSDRSSTSFNNLTDAELFCEAS